MRKLYSYFNYCFRYLPKLFFLKVRWVLNRDFKRELYIHIGMPKTGSSAIQAFLALNPEFLLVNNISYPRHPGFNQSFQTSSGNIPFLGDWVSQKHRKGFKIFLKSSLTKRVILSSEILFGLFKNSPRELAGFLEGYDYKIICYVRRMDELVESCINQQIKNHNVVTYGNIESVVNEQDYYSAFLDSTDVFNPKDIIIKEYSKKAFEKQNIYSVFLSIFNIKMNSIVTFPSTSVNPSLNLEALEFRRLLNILQISMADVNLKYQINTLLAFYSVEAKHRTVLKQSILTIEKKQELIERFRDKEQNFLKKYKLDYMFSNKVIDNYSQPKELTREVIVKILDFMLSKDKKLAESIIAKITQSSQISTETTLLVSTAQNYITQNY